MTRYIHLVFSDPPAGVSAADFDGWYEAHLQEILAVDGWLAATRYRIEPVVGADGSGVYRYLSVYELDCPPEVAVANLAAAGMGDADQYIGTKDDDAGVLPLPGWFADVRFASWNCTGIGERVTPSQSG